MKTFTVCMLLLFVISPVAVQASDADAKKFFQLHGM